MPLHETVSLVSTELDAVNSILSGIGEAPVNSLSGPLPADVAVAVNTLKGNPQGGVQLERWHFSTEDGYAHSPNQS